MAWIEHEYADAGALVEAVAAQLQAECVAALSLRGRATMALAGGKTPLPIYQRLAANDLAWDGVRLLPTDERCVPHEHSACNLREIRAAFSAAAGVRVNAITPADGDADRALAFADEVMATYPDPFDAVVLGMGTDGHTASLFPAASGLADALDPDSNRDVCRIDPVPLPPEAPFPRISLTVARLLRARSAHLIITGQIKRDVLHRAQREADALRHPIGAILHAPGRLLHIHWSP
jgi:6-phosphogluconolactonase